jgi:hypothetical protein
MLFMRLTMLEMNGDCAVGRAEAEGSGSEGSSEKSMLLACT